MRVFKAVALLGCAFLASVAMGAASIPEEQDVLVLDDDNFDAAIEAHPLLLVEFYAPWCGHCKKLEPEYAKAAGELKKQDPRIYIAKIDASAHKTAGEKHNIRGFPTLKLFKSGSVLDYNGGRSADDIVEFMIKKSGPPATTLKSKDDAKAFLEKHAAGAGIAFFKSLTDEAATKFLDFAGKNDAFPLAITDDAGVLSEYKAKAGTLQFVTKEGAATKALEGAEDKDLAAFMFAHSVAVFQEYSAATNRALFGGPISVHVLSIFDKAGKDFDKLAAEVKKVGEKRRTDALFIHMPTSEDKILGAFDMKAEDAPKVVIADLRSGALKKYFLEEPITAKNVESFLDKFLKGELKAKLKTEAVAPEDTTGPVTVLKGASFNDLVIANDKDVLVEFYAPWCGHCKSLAPKYDELGAKFKGVKTVTIAKMDSTANEIEVPGVDIRGFPTILFFPGNKKDSPVPYEGAREVADFTKFIKKNAATPFSLDDEDEDEDADEANDEL